METVLAFCLEHWSTIGALGLFLMSEILGKKSKKYSSVIELATALLKAKGREDVKAVAKDAADKLIDHAQEELKEEVDEVVDKAADKLNEYANKTDNNDE